MFVGWLLGGDRGGRTTQSQADPDLAARTSRRRRDALPRRGARQPEPQLRAAVDGRRQASRPRLGGTRTSGSPTRLQQNPPTVQVAPRGGDPTAAVRPSPGPTFRTAYERVEAGRTGRTRTREPASRLGVILPFHPGPAPRQDPPLRRARHRGPGHVRENGPPGRRFTDGSGRRWHGRGPSAPEVQTVQRASARRFPRPRKRRSPTRRCPTPRCEPRCTSSRSQGRARR